ncbi:cyclic nucleotide-binding domain-containing protein 2-like isoform X5 [Mytilus edulis]|uniref:cyclic nucleotide-binding domain-containing protein 2-like isoform X5 n=1 Tax=Mytilus edulis TaxID=6550 RepID=UPI0039F0F25A
MANVQETLNHTHKECRTPLVKWRLKPRQKISLLQKFRLCGRLAIICYRLCKFSYNRVDSNKAAFLSILQESDQMSDNKNIDGLLFDPNQYKANKQDRVPIEGKRILRVSPQKRTERDLRYLQVCLRNIKAFAEYPKTMQERLCRVGWYETYEPRRAIVRQGHLPHSFYFILSGVIIVTQYDEERGCTKFLVCLGRGMAFGELAVITNSRRQATCSTRTTTELLCISAKDFVEIFMSGGIHGFRNPEQESFMRNVPFLKEWPIELLPTNPKACMFHFFNRGQVLVRDSNRSDWIYIVKSGSLSVFKKLKTVEAQKAGNKHLNDRVRTPEGEKEQLVRKKRENFETWQYRSNLKSHSKIDKRKKQKRYFKNQFEMEHFLGAYLATPSRRRSSISTISDHLDEGEQEIRQAETTMGQGRKTIADEFEDNKKKGDDDEESDEEEDHSEFIELCVLERGQYFGLTAALYPDQPSLILASNGAECIMISKKFFLEKCSEEALRNINKIESPFPNDEDLQKRLQEYVNWTSHRKQIYNSLVKDIHFQKAKRMQRLSGQLLSFRPV